MPGVADITETYVTPDTLDRELEAWMTEVAPYAWRETAPLDAARAALLVVDMNRPFVDADGALSSPNAPVILPRVAEAVEAFRVAGRPVVWIVQGHHSVAHDRGPRLAGWWPTPILEGTSDVELAQGLAAAEGEKVIVKRRYSAFHETDLDLTLRCLDIAHVVVCGVLTHVCPFTTAMDAFMRNYGVYYLADGTAAFNRAQHVGALQSVAGWCGYVVRTRDVGEWLES
jgi:ureidoacrylate peracid hydrolase